MRYNLGKIRTKSAYTISEVAKLQDVSRRTVSNWIKQGLGLLDPYKNPKLIMGSDLRSFLEAKRKETKVILKWNEFYCLKCRQATLAKRGTEKTEKTGKKIGKNNRDQDIITAKCKHCGSSVCRFI